MLALFLGALAPDEPSPIPVPNPQWVVSDRIASVHLKCLLSDQSGSVVALHLIQSGRQLVLGAHKQRDEMIDDPVLHDPVFTIVTGSDERFSKAALYVPGGRSERPSIGDRGDIVFLSQTEEPVALFRFPKPYVRSEGVPIVAFLPLRSDPQSLETLAGVCSRTRLEDKPA